MSDDQFRRPPDGQQVPPDDTAPGQPAHGWGGHGEKQPQDAPHTAALGRPSRPPSRSALGERDSERTQEVPVVTQPGGPLPPRPATPGRPPVGAGSPPAARTTVLPETGRRPRTTTAASSAGAPGAGPASATGATATGAGPAPSSATGTVRRDVRPTARGSRRRARLTLRRIDPWSVFTTSLLLSLFLGLVLIIAVLVLYGLLDSVGVLESVSEALGTVGVIDEGAEVVSAGQVLLATSVIAAVDVVLLTVLATLFAFLYNLVASLTGGVQVTLSEGE